MIPINSDYKSEGSWDFPSQDINPTLKTDKYCRANSQAIYSMFCRNQTAWGHTEATKFTENRLYSTGKQSTEQYKTWLANDSTEDSSSTTATSVTNWDDLALTKTAKREGWYNLLWKNLSPAPSIMNQLHGQFDKQDFDLYVDTIDADSRGLMQDEKYRMQVEANFADWQTEFKLKAGIPIDEEMIYPQSQEEFDMFEAEEGFKLTVATSMQKLLRHSFDISRWDNVIRKKIVDDLVCIGYGAVRDYFDEELGKWRVKYLDPANVIIQYSNEFDYNDSDYAGYVTYYTISNLRKKLPHVPEDEIRALAYSCYGKYGNPSTGWESTKYSDLDPVTRLYEGINNFKVPVLEALWMDNNSEKKLYYHNRHGRDLIIDLGYDGEARPLSKESISMGAKSKVKETYLRQPYQCSWVIGSDHVFDWGKVKMASRESLNKPQLPMHVEQLLQPPIIENLIPIFDEIAQLYLRYQNSLAMMVERGYALNTAMLGNVSLGGQLLDVAEVVKMWQQTGRLLYSYGGNGMYTGGAALPVTPIDGGLGTRVDETIKSLEFAFRKIELFVGINLASLGVTPEVGVPAGNTKEAMQSTMNALKPIADAVLEIKQSAGFSMMRRIQISIRNDERVRNTYKGVISPTEIDALKEMEGNGVQYGLTLKPKPDSMMKAQFNKWLDISLQDTRDGNIGLTTSDAIYFTTRLEAGADIFDLQKQMRYRIKKNQEKARQEKTADIQQQIDGNAQNEQQKHANEMEKITIEQQGKTQEELIRGKIKDNLASKEMVAQLYTELREAANAEAGITTSST